MPLDEDRDDKNYEEASFSDVLSAIVTGTTSARAVCDQEVTQIAQMYKQDMFLKSFSVPRLRIENVVVDIPLNVCGLKKSQNVQMDTPDNICKSIDQALIDLTCEKELIDSYLVSIANINSTLKGDSKEFAKKQVDDLIAEFFEDNQEPKERLKNILEDIKFALRGLENKISRNRDFKLCLSELQVIIEIKSIIRKAFSTNFDSKDYSKMSSEEKSLKNRSDEEQLAILKSRHIYEIVNYICSRVIYTSITKQEIKSDIMVDVVTDRVKNNTTPDTMMRIQIKLKEEGMIWQNYKGDSDKEDRWNLTLE